MSIGEVQLQGNTFVMDGQEFDLDTLITALNMSRVEIIDKQIADQANIIKSRNAELAQLNDVLSEIQAKKPAEADGTGSLGDTVLPGSNPPMTLTDYLTNNGLVPADLDITGEMNGPDFDAILSKVKGRMDSLNSTSQMDMIRLQGLTNKRNQAFDLMSNIIAKVSKARDNIISNIR